ncbi:MAG: hypothetical protein O2779_04725 [Nanoarchaeota archaeon]|nr:hypothetical protein [Nanoarchaeota archaeon]
MIKRNSCTVLSTTPILHIVAEEFVPFEYEEEGIPKGIDVDITQIVLDRLNVPYEIKIIPGQEPGKCFK